jgi:hypothetical protein
MSRKVILRFALAFFVLIILIASMTIVPALLNHQNGNDDQSKKTVQVFEEGGKTVESEFSESGTREIVIETRQGALSEQRQVTNQTTVPQIDQVIVNDIKISITNPHIEKERFFVDVCFDRPDAADWVIHEATIKAGTESYALTGTNLIQVREAPVEGKQEVSDLNSFRIEESDGSDKGLRCDTLYFNINPESDYSELTLEIPLIYANPREGEECLPAQISKLQTAIDARVKGIQIQCNNEISEDGGGSSGIVVLQKPDSLTDAELNELMTDQSLYNEAFGFFGPWKFVITKIE